MLLRELGVKAADFESLFTGPDRTMFTEGSKNMLAQQDTEVTVIYCVFLSPLIRQGI